MSKRKGRQSFNKLRKIRTSLWNESPRCYYCNKITTLPTDIGNLDMMQNNGETPDYMATVEHLYTRYDAERFEEGGDEKCVLACYKCNHEKEIERTKLVPKEELHKRSKRYPLSKFVSEYAKKEIVKYVFGGRNFLNKGQVEKHVNEYLLKTDLEIFSEKYEIDTQYVLVIIKQHKNFLKRQIKDGEQQTKIETVEG